jgi:hypothetical protein
MKIKNLFKPNWIIIEVVHERYSFDTYYTYYKHRTLDEIERVFLLDKTIREELRDGAYVYDQCGREWEPEYETEDPKYGGRARFTSYGIEYTIVIPAKKYKTDFRAITGETKHKFGLFDKKLIKDSTDE